MPEALAIAAVVLVAATVYVLMWVQSRTPALLDPRRERARLERHLKWLEHRLAVARREGWGHEMTGNLTADLSATEERLAQLERPAAEADTSAG